MDVDRHPREVVNRLPGGDQRSRVGDPVRRHHEREPGIRDQHDRGAHDIEADPQEEMNDRMELAPSVVVGVEEEGLREEEQDVGKKRRGEHAHHVVRELRIQDDEHERQGCSEGRGERERDREELRELVGEPVVSLITRLVADRLDENREDRHGKDEGREQEVELRNRPDGHAAPDDGEGSVLGLDVRLCPSRRFRCCALVGQSRRARRRVDDRGRSPVRLLVLAVRQERRDQHDGAEHHQTGDGTEHEQQFAVHRCAPPSAVARGLAAGLSAVAVAEAGASAEAGALAARASRSRCSPRT